MGKSKVCPPNCACGRHRAVHPDDCECKRCGGSKQFPSESKSYTTIQERERHRRTDRCVCGHVMARHDAFGCKTCEMRVGSPMCVSFRLRGSPRQPRDNTFAREIAREGFIAHIDEIATCTTCWQPIKIGFNHSVSCVINARAHGLKCREHAESVALMHSSKRTG